MRKQPQSNFGLKAALSLSVGMTALLASGPLTATAQEDGEETKRLTTVTTTATKREQTLQDVPIAVSVVDIETMQDAQIVDILDLQSVVPSLRVSQLQQSGNSSFVIRGFGNGSNNIGIEPAVAVFIDGVYRTRAAGGLADYADIERIEVLRGPQSTLFGKNASVGVISVVTQAPEFESGGTIEATLGNYNSKILKGRVTGPIGDTVAVSLSGSMNTRDGYADNVALGTELNDRDRWSIKGQVLIEPADNLSIRLIADYDELDEVCCFTPNIINGPTGAAIQFAGGQVISDPFSYTTALDQDPINEISNGGLSMQIDWETGLGTVTSITSTREQDVYSDGDVDFTSLRVTSANETDYRTNTFTQELRLSGETENFDYLVGGFYFDENVDLQSNVLYGDQFYPYAAALAGATGAPTLFPALEASLGYAPLTFFEAGTGSREEFNQKNESYSLFGQTDWHLTDRLTATLGLAYIDDQKTVTANAVSTDVLASIDLAAELSDPDVLRALPLADITAIGASFDNIVLATAYELVTSTPFDVADYTALLIAAGGGDPVAIATVGGINATAANPAVIGGTGVVVGGGLASVLTDFQFLPGFLNFPNSVEGNSSNDDELTYTARLAYDVNDSLNVYGSYATGYKATSWNLTRDSSYFASDAAALAGQIPTNRAAGTRFAAPEETKVFELGAKWSTSNLNVNVAVFDQTVENFQSTIFQGTGFVLANAGEQSTTGIEWDLTWLPTDHLTLGFAGLVQDPTYDSFVNAPVQEGSAIDLADGTEDGSGDLSGAQPGGISETSLFFSGKYDYDLNDNISGFVRGDYVYESEIPVVDNIPQVTREVSTMNASAGLSWENGLDVSVWVRNLNKDEYFTSGFPTVAQAGSVNGYTNAPQSYGITMRKSF